MCGRYTNTVTESEVITDAFDLEVPPEEPLSARYNIAPTQLIDTVAIDREGKRRLVPMRWGLVPSWSKDASRAGRMINARAETVAEKPSFRTPFRRKRCLIVADGFYEWKATDGGAKQPMYICLKDRSIFGLAGLWDQWKDPVTGELLITCTIITTTANEYLSPIHDRMPVILPQEHYDLWLDRSMEDRGTLQALLQPYPDEKIDAYPVSTLVNHVRNDSVELIEPIA